MRDWRDVLVKPESNLHDTIRQIDDGTVQIALVVDNGGRLLGTVTDGDVRRALLRGMTLESSVLEVMNKNPTLARSDSDRESLLALMQSRKLHHVPIVDDAGVVVGLETLGDLLSAPSRDNWVVLMAGGAGTRLRPLTDLCPKPMLQIGERPILQHILESFINHGYRRFFFSVNYLAEVIERHFGDGSRWGVQIEYLREHTPLGTAGALSLLQERPSQPMFIMNGDLLTNVNFNALLDFHESHRAVATMCVRNYEYQIPFGVVAMDGHRLLAIDEKPKQRCFVSAGIYVLAPQVLDLVPAGRYLDMPSLFETLINAGHPTAVFPLREYWFDIGRIEDFDQASGEFAARFK
jgi:dTDP-glucose pyrophosphorylase